MIVEKQVMQTRKIYCGTVDLTPLNMLHSYKSATVLLRLLTLTPPISKDHVCPDWAESINLCDYVIFTFPKT